MGLYSLPEHIVEWLNSQIANAEDLIVSECSCRFLRKIANQMKEHSLKRLGLLGLNWEVQNIDMGRVICYAIQKDKQEAIYPLLVLRAEVNNCACLAHPPLFLESGKKNADKKTIDMLLAANAQVNMPTTGNGYTALMSSTQHDNAGIVKVLIRAKADANAEDQHGWSALIWAIWAMSKQVDKKGETVMLLVNSQAEINHQEHKGRTALMKAAEWNNSWAIELLLENGGDVNLISNRGHTALMFACFNTTSSAIVEKLIKAKSDINAKNQQDTTPLDFVKYREPTDCAHKLVKILLDAGAQC